MTFMIWGVGMCHDRLAPYRSVASCYADRANRFKNWQQRQQRSIVQAVPSTQGPWLPHAGQARCCGAVASPSSLIAGRYRSRVTRTPGGLSAFPAATTMGLTGHFSYVTGGPYSWTWH